ncbi:MAG: UDP-N-acetylmuramoyl-tripeptide-D-alanyl-D-alanine ligase [Berkelbacteria bacterium GW2011_GWB1_38_5]|uniref:UDP-N-acetylmuramoyl-tripeptide-D-alanyl-D-alanine ligase n=2 Tax=Candidatus Berkelbacteria TaxID=1618330 RepID=A0A0G0NYV4_9BACT|nr:MAG: UDP-N-acetylmuramoyl-tripeptide-D-alanyl-D-alanine ligase [Berkelbacteria bacterium GW2011_GWB1_38_5]KKQ91044.1 MAG: UDP-N-acetylmuramoyl-tripeptide-D-alanyl-D-alanine ligase [Berkelbacteria bacterium GW2011_GWA1_39_10]
MFSKLLQSCLKFWAKCYLKRSKPDIVAITGSVGKTSTKDAIFEVLKVKFDGNIRKSEGNLNNETGVPLAILGYKKSPSIFFQWLPIVITCPFKSIFSKKNKVLVLEIAADKPGDIRYLTDFVKPKIAVLTSIGPAHLAAFGKIEKIIEEKTDLLRALSEDGWAVLNIDDEKVREVLNSCQFQVTTYGIEEPADIYARNITTEIIDYRPITKFQIIMGEKKLPAVTFTLGKKWNIYAALSAASVGKILGMDLREIVAGIKQIKPEKQRLMVYEGKKQTIIIDDTYNANPVSMRAALDVLKNLPNSNNSGKKYAVLGDMLEIGNISDEAHNLIGDYAREVADEVISVGELSKRYKANIHFDDSLKAADYLLNKIHTDDIILLKASRAIKLEKIVEVLKK